MVKQGAGKRLGLVFWDVAAYMRMLAVEAYLALQFAPTKAH